MIPLPTTVEFSEGKFQINPDTTIFASSNLSKIVGYFSTLLQNSIDYELGRAESENQKDAICFKLNSNLSQLNDEGYQLLIKPESIQITAFKSNGIFYGIQTLRQLLPPEIERKVPNKKVSIDIPCIQIEDYPRFKWRGFMFDVGRHFHDVDTIKRSLDLMALLKLNVFHLHLTEDQGWRIEIKQYPRLTEIGSRRNDTKLGGWTSKKYRGQPHEGYFTQKDIREIVQYADERFITVVPEIEMPGHSSAAIASYPELSCKKETVEVPSKFGIFSDIFCAGQEDTYVFLEKVLDEILELFPSKIIHIGGDEVPKKNWKECEICQKRMVDEDLDSVSDLHSYFTNRIADFLISRGRRMMGWNEILNENTEISTIGQYWLLTSKKKVMNHMKRGGDIVVSNFFRYYLDYNYLVTSLKKCYTFEPIPKKLEQHLHRQILGVEAPIWTEWVPNVNRLDWQVFPRLAAIAETGWTQKENKKYKSFWKRLIVFLRRLDVLGVNYATPVEINPSILKRLFRLRKTFKWPEI